MQDWSFEEKKKTPEEDSLSKMGDDVKGDAAPKEEVHLEDMSTEIDKGNVEGDEPEEVDLADTILKADGSYDGLWGSEEWMSAVDEIEGVCKDKKKDPFRLIYVFVVDQH
ncbi:unnamed protein product [Linum trigynum]|uniref:Uncharacterized protein n=1 Tax=Linum trigynum TaxID=586398 RepID=A0AAV2EAP6_9ROSI